MNYTSYRLQQLETSATIAMNQRSREMKAAGYDIINMSVGEPDFNTPDHIKEAAYKAIHDNITFYPPVPGYPELREAVVRKFKRENQLNYEPSQVCVTTGAKQAIFNSVMSIVDKGDEVIIPAPYWVSYSEIVKVAEGTPIILESSIKENFKVSAERIEKAITPKTKLLMLCSPNNPSGAIFSKEELEAIAKVVAKHDRVFVISDEIYEHINFIGGHTSIAQFESIKDRVVVVNGVSKAYAMTGWRLGYMAAPQWITDACIKLQGQTTTGATTIAQCAAIEALTGDQSCVSEMNKAFIRRKDLVVKMVNEIEGIKLYEPDGAFYVFPDVSSYFGKKFEGNVIKNASELCLYLLEKGLIATVTGEAFGNGDCIRISYATADEKLVEAMKRMKGALENLK